MKVVRAALVAVVVAAELLLFVRPQAASAASPSGITLTPFIENVTLLPGDTQKSFSLTITNHTGSVQELDLKAQDFGSLNNTGGIILEGSNTYTQKYGLISWLTLSTDTVVLKAGQSQTILVTIDNRSSLQPGGHYGAVVAGLNSLGAPQGNHVQINEQLSALILVDKTGGEHYDLALDSESANGNWLHLPNNVRLVFKNPGNVHVVPRGLVKLETAGGTVVAQGIINSESAFILPESYRQVYVPLTAVRKAPPLPGAYKLVVSYRYDGITTYAVKTFGTRYIDLPLYISVVLAALVIGVTIWHRKRPGKVGSKQR